jgi:Uncharacterized conserved protein
VSRWHRHGPNPAGPPDPANPSNEAAPADPDRTEWIPTPGRSWQTSPLAEPDSGGEPGPDPQRSPAEEFTDPETPTEWITAPAGPTNPTGDHSADRPSDGPGDGPEQSPTWFLDLATPTEAPEGASPTDPADPTSPPDATTVVEGPADTDGAPGHGDVPAPQPVVDGQARARQRASARAEVLGRVRAAIGGRPAPEDDVPRGYRRTLGISRDEVVELFADRVADYKATVRRIAREELPATIAVSLVEHGIRRVAVPLDLPAYWLPRYVDVRVDDGRLTGVDLDALDGVITGCALAIAETGTIVLDGGRLQGRRMLSLVPDYHLCVVDALDVVGNLPEAVGRLDPTRPITFISGPSATSDIELDRVEGVHGPRILDVLITG